MTLLVCKDEQLNDVAPAIVAFVKKYSLVPGNEALYYYVKKIIDVLMDADDDDTDDDDDDAYRSALYLFTETAENIGVSSDAIFDGIARNKRCINELRTCWHHDKDSCSKFDWKTGSCDAGHGNADKELDKFLKK